MTGARKAGDSAGHASMAWTSAQRAGYTLNSLITRWDRSFSGKSLAAQKDPLHLLPGLIVQSVRSHPATPGLPG